MKNNIFLSEFYYDFYDHTTWIKKQFSRIIIADNLEEAYIKASAFWNKTYQDNTRVVLDEIAIEEPII